MDEYKLESENAELSKTAGELLENAGDPKFANSKVINTTYLMVKHIICADLCELCRIF